MALSGIPIDPQQCIGDSLVVLNNSFIELDSRTLNLSSDVTSLTLVVGASSGNLYTTIQDVSGNLYTLIQQTSSEGGGLIVPVKFSFTGNGSQTSFGLTGTSLSNDPVSYRVTFNGVVQNPGVDFNIVGSNLVFTSPPPAGVTIVVVTADEFGNINAALSGGDYELRALSATWNNTSVNQANYFPLSGGTITGSTQINSTLTVSGTISSSGVIYSQGGAMKPLSGVGGIVVNNNSTNVTVISADSSVSAGSVKAWVNYNGVSNTINSNYNVSSVTKISTGIYTINFLTPMVDTNYATVLGHTITPGGINIFGIGNPINTTKTTTSVTLSSLLGTSARYDQDDISAVIYR